MGASNDSRTYLTTDKAVIKKKWNEAVEDSLHEDGHSYSGCIGMLGTGIEKWKDLQLPTQAEAQEYIDDNHDKWDGAMAVSFKEGDKEGWVVGGWCSS